MHADRTVTGRRLHTRRALGLMAMSAVVPGSAQFVAGNRALGRVAMRVWAMIWGLVLLSAVALLFVRGPFLAVLFAPGVTTVLQIAAWVIFLGWALLLFDAWRLSRPSRLPRPARLALTVSCVVLVSIMGFTTNLVANAFTAAGNVSTVLKGGGESDKKEGRYNILLLGVDAAAHREGIRPDSMNVASVDAETGRTILFGLPRNLEGAPFPDDSPLHTLYPEGYRCDDSTCMLNGIQTLAEENADLYPGNDAGPAAMVEVAEELLGLDINYYAMVDMAGFTNLIDAMGGITLNVGRDIPIGGGTSPVSGYVEAGEGVHLDGYEALWLARSRHDSDDYERMVRQKCVMSAMVKQLDASLVAKHFLELSEAGKDILVTDVGAGHVAELADLALQARALDLESVDFTPPLINTADPDFALIRSTVIDAIKGSEAKDDPNATQAQSSVPPVKAEPDEKGSPAEEDQQESASSEPLSESEIDDGQDVDADANPDDAPPVCSVS